MVADCDGQGFGVINLNGDPFNFLHGGVCGSPV